MKLGAFLISYYGDAPEPVGHVAVLITDVVPSFGERLWAYLFPRQSLPPDLLTRFLIQRAPNGVVAAPIALSPPVADPRWHVRPIDEPTIPFVEVTLSQNDHIYWRGSLDMGSVFDFSALATVAGWAEHGDLDMVPGRYRYDVKGIPLAKVQAYLNGPRLELPEAPGSFVLELPDLDADPLIFTEIEPGPLENPSDASVRFHVTAEHSPGPIRMTAAAWDEVAQHLELPFDREVGGHLVGTITGEDGAHPTVTVRHVVPARASAGDATRFIMSPESGATVLRLVDREWPGETVVGWYHTHVFASADGELDGLSEVDHAWHDKSFSQPWSLALLVNVWRKNDQVSRRIRIYRRNAELRLVESSFDVIEERV